jgi:mRNA (guanine-N7-)-methyltransferase
MEGILSHYKEAIPRCPELEPVHLYNNFVKAGTIQSFIKHHAYVFDMACGRGGDLKKYAKHHIAFYFGIDVVPERIQEAETRHKNLHCMFTAVFEVANFLQPLILQSTYDFVSCQFAIHYAWGCREHATQVFENAMRLLNDDACFCLSFPDFYVIRERLKHMSTNPDEHNHQARDATGVWVYRIGGPHHYLEFTSTLLLDEFLQHLEREPYGQKYIYYQKGAIHGVEEFIVNPTEFKSLTEKNGLMSYVDCNFLDFEKALKPEFNLSGLKEQMKVRDLGSQECRTIVGLYRNVVLMKNRKRRKYSCIKDQ